MRITTSILIACLFAALAGGETRAQDRPAPGQPPIQQAELACGGQIASASPKAQEEFGWSRASVEKEAFYAFAVRRLGRPLSCTGSQTADGEGYDITYAFPDEALLDASTTPSATHRTLLIPPSSSHALDEKAAREVLHDMAGASTGIDWDKPRAGVPVDSAANPLLLKGWTQTVFGEDDECRAGAALVFNGKRIVGLLFDETC